MSFIRTVVAGSSRGFLVRGFACPEPSSWSSFSFLGSRWCSCDQGDVPQQSRGGVDRSKFPTLDENDLEEKFTKGSGPGGQSVNKTVNAVFLRHVPSGLRIKCHETRSLEKNRQIARERLLEKLDELLNGELSVAAQKSRLKEAKSRKAQSKSRKLRELKEKWKAEREKSELEEQSS